MEGIGEKLVVSSVNCNGLTGRKKRIDVLDYLKKQKIDILCLQETHWTEDNLRMIKQQWNNELIIHGDQTSSRGVAILFSNRLEFKILTSYKDYVGRILAIDLLISNEFSIRIINIYAPNHDSPDFFEEVNILIQDNQSDHLIICGDFNS